MASGLGVGTLTNGGWWSSLSETTASGETVNQKTALGIAAVYACVDRLSRGIASTPIQLFEKIEKGKRLATNRNEFFLLTKKPNQSQTAFVFWQSIMVDVLLRGNAFARIVRDANGFITELKYYRASDVSVFEHSDGSLTYAFNRLPGRYLASEVLHFRNLGTDGLVGQSVLSLHRNAFGNSLSAQKMQGRQFKHGTSSGRGWYEVPEGVGVDKARATSDLIAERYTGENFGTAMVLPYGSKFHPVSISQRDAQYIETMKFNQQEIASIFNVPLHKIGSMENATRANIEEQNIEWVTDSLTPWVENITQEIDSKLFELTDPYFTQGNFANLRKGDMESMTNYITRMIYSGVMNVNEGREILGLNPIENGDDYLQPSNTLNIQQVMAELDKKKAETEKLLAEAENKD